MNHFSKATFNTDTIEDHSNQNSNSKRKVKQLTFSSNIKPNLLRYKMKHSIFLICLLTGLCASLLSCRQKSAPTAHTLDSAVSVKTVSFEADTDRVEIDTEDLDLLLQCSAVSKESSRGKKLNGNDTKAGNPLTSELAGVAALGDDNISAFQL